jgi:hypothetical protein
MCGLEKVGMTVIVAGVGVVVKNSDSLIKCVDGENYQDFLPCHCSKFEAEERDKVPENGADGRKCNWKWKNIEINVIILFFNIIVIIF